jgi:SAM-dependent methyltransferase
MSDATREAYDVLAPGYETMTAHHRYDEWTELLEGLAIEAGLQGRRLLDVACGTGKSFEPFLRRGYSVRACDLSPAMAALARERAGGRAEVEVHDMVRLPVLGSFDLVTCLDDAVNYLDPPGLRTALAAMAANLAVGGVLVFDTNTLRTYRTFYATLDVTQAQGQVVVWEGRAPSDLAAGGRAEADVEVLSEGADGWTRRRCRHVQNHHPVADVLDAIGAAGLGTVRVVGMNTEGLTGDGVDELEDSKAVYVARAR